MYSRWYIFRTQDMELHSEEFSCDAGRDIRLTIAVIPQQLDDRDRSIALMQCLQYGLCSFALDIRHRRCYTAVL